ncbi:hypothetical protein K227x_57470 [Rubripirellula lacrimiformis]|uniref:Bacterial Ig-like domain (Group 2) n=1 Tax=Rubripirellula lacrimiformis TaxID=1930273 RepID=A0A517NJL9_9BACT|nr:DUF1549 and DUF1553 domain-containing protein [Rubripirellula lacrimiformis]QDT07320.1 hypothetical protein K227x_57470 [Rubripirellula lacrimiformis]
MSDRLFARLSSVPIAVALVLLGIVCQTAVLPGSVLADQTAVDRPTDSELPVSFELDVQPILAAQGCNAGACHGKQRGQNGFQLSLLGFDSDFDYASIVRQARGRRLTIRSPESSLLIQKATAQLPHGGGRKIEVGSDSYATLVAWIRQGAPRRVDDEPSVTSVEIAKTEFLLKPAEVDQLSVVAHYSDGSTRDVTSLTGYLANDSAVVSVDDSGKLVAGPIPGETAVMARYMNHIRVANVSIPRTASLPDGYYDQQPRANFIDDLVYDKLNQLQIQLSDPASESIFLRRVYTDVIGRVPTVEEADQFLRSSDPAKREQLVDHLLNQPEYIDHWANQWADLLRPNPYRVGIKAVLNYDNWIRQQFREDVSYDEFARRLITAKGSTWQNGASTLFRDRRSPDEVATLVSQLFLGVRLECAKCHHHPFEKWSQHDFYSFAAYFGKVGRKGTGLSPPISGGEEIVFVSTKGDVKHPVTDEVLAPSPLFGKADVPEGTDPRDALATWMTSPQNDYFAKVHVNRLWAHLMGRGIVDPVDDLRSTNPPSNPALLDALAVHFQESGYNQKDLIKSIVLSNVYSLSSVPNETNASDRLNYSRHYRHRLRAEVLADAVADVTETSESFSALAPQSRSNQVWTHRIESVFLDTFGRPDENQDPPCERIPDSSVTQTLHLMNSTQIDGRIRSDSSRAARLAKSDQSAADLVSELYLAIFSRTPNADEQRYCESLITDAGENRRTAVEDLMWAMMNSPEFIIQN